MQIGSETQVLDISATSICIICSYPHLLSIYAYLVVFSKVQMMLSLAVVLASWSSIVLTDLIPIGGVALWPAPGFLTVYRKIPCSKEWGFLSASCFRGYVLLGYLTGCRVLQLEQVSMTSWGIRQTKSWPCQSYRISPSVNDMNASFPSCFMFVKLVLCWCKAITCLVLCLLSCDSWRH